MRRYYLVCYDIRQSKRLQRMHRLMAGYGDPLQYSVFLCLLSRAEVVTMLDAIKEVINQREDSVLVVDLGKVKGARPDCIQTLGCQKLPEMKNVFLT
ncbi:CRISPR-associated endonuclease Cas2 [Rhodothermus marinus]|uniref:CRISPR-associated endoribonuclease Cas2 n=1 Tax=Rhodothermus marinus (strain ATCC 43812 / DSM 4252 / R-10) TaxID=518766 RepID=D0MKV6_RHOM4|nr:CRISPR-associated endonuclease Cas2 [Rhodothermus marinus]ACY49770.1 CRISPR-associated protein Cas2 [Rhodothermus marinus DSM 4252]